MSKQIQEVARATASSLRPVPGGPVTLRDRGVSQKLSPRSPQQPFFSREARRPRRPDRLIQVAPFAMAAVPVTASAYAWSGAGESPVPAVEVSWLDAIAYCNRLSELSDLSSVYEVRGHDVILRQHANGYRLPTEAEWEHACRGGVLQPRYGALDEIAWYGANSGGAVHAVGLKAPNAFGLHDMLGNVWEWCWDLFDEDEYGRYRVFRGGGFADPESAIRADCRRKSHPLFKVDDLGFRLARNACAELVP